MIPPDYVRRHAAASPTAVDRGRLCLLVLESGQAFLTRAREAIERGDVAAFVADLGRTRDVVRELGRMLDRDGGDVAASLGRLHERMVRELAHANAARSLALVDDWLGAYAPILDAYRRVVATAGPA